MSDSCASALKKILMPWRRRRKVGTFKNQYVVIETQGASRVVEEKTLATKDKTKKGIALLRNLVKNDMLSTRFSNGELKRIVELFNRQHRAESAETDSKTMLTGGSIVGMKRRITPNGVKHILGISGDMGNAIVASLPTGDDGKVGLHQFLQWFSTWRDSASNNKDELLVAFQIFDKNRDGFLSKEEFCNMIETNYVKESQMPHKRMLIETYVARALSKAGDSSMTCSQFKSWASSADDDIIKLHKDALVRSFKLYTSVNDTQKLAKAHLLQVFSTLLPHMSSGEQKDKGNDAEEAREIAQGLKRKAKAFVDKAFSQVDDNNDNVLSYDEFKQWCGLNDDAIDIINGIRAEANAFCGRHSSVSRRLSAM